MLLRYASWPIVLLLSCCAQTRALARAIDGLCSTSEAVGGSAADMPDNVQACTEAAWRAAERGAGDRSATVRAHASRALTHVVVAHGASFGSGGSARAPVEGVVDVCKQVRAAP